jgi:hypothetical protein
MQRKNPKIFAKNRKIELCQICAVLKSKQAEKVIFALVWIILVSLA